MPTPRAGYWTADGKRVPSTTTIIGKFKEAGGLMHWAWQCGMDGLDYRKLRDDAASAGTLAHEMVERWIKSGGWAPAEEIIAAVIAEKRPAEEVLTRGRRGFETFLAWAEQTQLEPVETEIQLVSERHRFGGTLDSILLRKSLALGDWKTSNGIYADHMFQLAAYSLLWEENFPDRPIEGGYHLVRFDKENADFTHRFWSELEECKRGFLLMRELYDIKLSAERRCK